MYKMIYKTFPFKNFDKEKELKESIMNMELKIPYSSHISHECIKLLKGLLDTSASHRVTLESSLFDNWLEK